MWWHTRRNQISSFGERASPFKSAGGLVQSTTGRRAVHISLQGLYCSCKPVFCSHLTLTGYPLHSLVSPSLLLLCVTVCHHISKAVYLRFFPQGLKGLWVESDHNFQSSTNVNVYLQYSSLCLHWLGISLIMVKTSFYEIWEHILKLIVLFSCKYFVNDTHD